MYTNSRTRIPIRIPMRARAVDEPHRASTQLELLFDLTFVVAVAAAVVQLGHGLVEGHAAEVVWPSCKCSSRSGGHG